jgi:hypothetical protein
MDGMKSPFSTWGDTIIIAALTSAALLVLFALWQG